MLPVISPLDLACVVALGGWCAAEFGILWQARGTGARGGRYRGSYWALVGVFYWALGAAWAARILGILPAPAWLRLVGLGLVVLGILVRRWAIAALGQQFSLHVRVGLFHRLVVAGPFRLVRHPTYAGSLATLLGFPLACGTVGGALLTAALALPIYRYRIAIEERALLGAFGAAYQEYRARTWCLFPGW